MIKNLLLGVLITISTIAVKAQGIYSQENLEKASAKDLSLYLTKAQKVKKTGGVMLIASPVSAALGVLLWANAWRGGSEGEAYLGTGLIFASLDSAVIGIPVRITGASRVRKVSMILNNKQGTAIVDFKACPIYNFQTQQLQPGIKLGVRF
jgi:hypothetical protein